MNRSSPHRVTDIHPKSRTRVLRTCFSFLVDFFFFSTKIFWKVFSFFFLHPLKTVSLRVKRMYMLVEKMIVRLCGGGGGVCVCVDIRKTHTSASGAASIYT